MIQKSVLKSQHCNRNWDLDKTIPQKDIETFISAATQCTSKQNLDFYSVYAIQNRNIIEDIYDSTTTEMGRKNPQVLAQLLLVFVENSKDDADEFNREFVLQMLDYWENNLTNIFRRQKDILVADAVLELFRRRLNIENFNKILL